MLSAMIAKNGDVLQQLLSAGANLSIKNEFEETAYDLASQNELLTNDIFDMAILRVPISQKIQTKYK